MPRIPSTDNIGKLIKKTITTHHGNKKAALIAWLDSSEEFPPLGLIKLNWKTFLSEKEIEKIWTGHMTTQHPSRLRKVDLQLL